MALSNCSTSKIIMGKYSNDLIEVHYWFQVCSALQCSFVVALTTWTYHKLRNVLSKQNICLIIIFIGLLLAREMYLLCFYLFDTNLGDDSFYVDCETNMTI